MSANNIKIYDIFRKDLHLGDEKARELVSEMDEVYRKELIKDLATKTEVQALAKKLDQTDAKLDGFNIRLDGFHTRLDGFDARLDGFKDAINGFQVGFATFRAETAIQMKTDVEKFYSKMDRLGVLQYIAITGTILGALASLGVFKLLFK
ncbi:hypothetical protein SAMN04488128_107221 [Chitinophaga eiseniae]|uniref:Uncharacterized protein n=1 Tax=Chitinophaga eiseniae TaxID=634771 RepID=A0A1T4U0Z8_9BACT|nr:hypothetical protein [Chitinophaga eiseniae]SKA46201.1 hypothetical protein SAMN04488128_107221 [Chitinophaga eiseniae]